MDSKQFLNSFTEDEIQGSAKTYDNGEHIINNMDEDHTPLWIATWKWPELDIFLQAMLERSTNKVALSYRLRFSSSYRKEFLSVKDANGNRWLKLNNIEAWITKMRVAFDATMTLMPQKFGLEPSELKFSELTFTGRETTDEVIDIMQKSDLFDFRFTPNDKKKGKKHAN